MMVGRSVLLTVDKSPAEPAEVVLDVVGLSASDDIGLPAVRDISLQVRAGEILGIAGVEGNGQRELVQALTGLRACRAQAVAVLGQDALGKSPRDIHAMGVGHVPEDREADGLVGAYSVADNLVLDRYNDPEFARFGVRNLKAVDALADGLVGQFDIRTPSSQTTVQSLSGGNKQKVVIARELAAEPALLIAAQPTRGVDVGSIEFIHSQIVAARDRGAAVLLVSAELDEVLGLSDRIAVMYDGRIVETMEAQGADRGRIGLLMAGHAASES
jgi:simple sugar transport system ATP-binding protein